MKSLTVLGTCIFLSACGTIGLGSNHNTRIYNNSSDTISISAESGIYKINPNSDMQIHARNQITITNPNPACPQPIINSHPNGIGIFFDIVPGVILGIVPLFIDAVTNNLYKMPSQYSYACE